MNKLTTFSTFLCFLFRTLLFPGFELVTIYIYQFGFTPPNVSLRQSMYLLWRLALLNIVIAEMKH